MMQLRPYQQDAIAAIRRDWAAGLLDVLLVAATGAGKTNIFLSLLMEALDAAPARALIVAHRQELIEQPMQRIGHIDEGWLMRGDCLRPRVGVVMADRDDCDRQLVIATVQSLASGKRLQRLLSHGPIDILVTDEAHHCHVPGTLVVTETGLRAIEDVHVGESVYGWNGDSFDCHAVDNTFTYWYDGPIYEIATAGGRVVRVTPNHKLYTQGVRIYASQVKAVRTLSMPAMQLGDDDSISDLATSPLATCRHETLPTLLHRYANGGTRFTCSGASGRPAGVRDVWQELRDIIGAWWTRQFGAWGQPNAVTGSPSASDGETQRKSSLSETAFSTDDRQQSDGQYRGQNQDDGSDSRAPGNWQGEGVRWSPIRQRSDDDASRAACDGDLSEGVLSARGNDRRWATAGALQDRHSMAGSKGRSGTGRVVSHATRSASSRSAERSASGSARLDSTPHVESGRALREDRIVAVTVRHYTGLVHDIEVRDVHNYVANGLLSSNSTAPSYLKVYQALKDANPALRHLGVTATPMRGDGDGLARVYQTDSARITIADLVRQGFLVQPRWLGISTGISIAGIKTSGDDFVQAQLAKVFDTEQGRAIVLAAYQQYARDRRAIAFTASVAGAHDLAAAFNNAGIAAAAIDGTTPKDDRRRILDAFRRGDIQVVANCQVLTEGFDAPGTSCILMCRPTRSDSQYVQCMGRGLRPAVGMAQPGEDCLILDFLPAETRNIVMAGDVLGLPKHVVRTVTAEREAEPGEVQAGFTFDGEHFDTGGTPLEIIARQLDYLQASPFHWHRRDGWLVLGLGAGSDQVERILVISPAQDATVQRLYGLYRRGRMDGDYLTWGPWQSGTIAEGDFDALTEKAHEMAAKWGNAALSSKDRSWHQQPISDGQAKFLRRLATRDELGKLERISKGEAAALITHFQARQILRRAGAWS